MKYLREAYPKGEVDCTSIGKEILVIELHQPIIFKGIFFWRKVEIEQQDRVYLLFCNEKGEVMFREADQDEIEK